MAQLVKLSGCTLRTDTRKAMSRLQKLFTGWKLQ